MTAPHPPALQALLVTGSRGVEARVLDAVQQAVIATDPRGIVVFWNAYAAQLYGWTAEEALGRQILELTPTEVSRQDGEAILASLSAGRSWAGEFKVRRKDGTEFLAFVVDSPILDEQGALVAVVGVSTDITRQREVERQVREAAKLEAMGRVAGGVAHDFNNLLTVMLSSLDTLDRRHGTDEVSRPLLQVVRDATDRAADLTARLLSLGRRGRAPSQVVNVGAALASVFPLLRRLIPPQVEIVTTVWPDPLCVTMDATQLDQILINLAVNARDAMRDGGTLTFAVEPVDALNARADVSPSGDFVRLTVCDTGVGMSPEVMARVFEPFFTTKAEAGGAGFGLANAYAAVAAAHGVVDLESAVGRGSCFRIVFPRTARSEPGQDEQSAAWPSRTNATVLLVEADAAVRLLAERVLRRHGYEVRVASSAAGAVAVVEGSEDPIDLVLCDLALDGVSGVELASALRVRLPNLKVLLMSGFEETEVLERSERAFARAVLAKPFRPRELTDAVEAALRS